MQMKRDLAETLKYWYLATVKPRKAIGELAASERKIAVGFWINLLFAGLYTSTVVIYYFVIERLPAVEPWMPIPADRYYLYQIFWTIPWGLSTWIMMSGIVYLLAIAGKKEPARYCFDGALLVCGIGWVVPNLILMWIPETLLVPIFGVFWPEWAELIRLTVIPPIWQTALVALGVRKIYDVHTIWATVLGLVSVGAFFIMFLAFMR
jgi:hypothetical protein